MIPELVMAPLEIVPAKVAFCELSRVRAVVAAVTSCIVFPETAILLALLVDELSSIIIAAPASVDSNLAT